MSCLQEQDEAQMEVGTRLGKRLQYLAVASMAAAVLLTSSSEVLLNRTVSSHGSPSRSRILGSFWINPHRQNFSAVASDAQTVEFPLDDKSYCVSRKFRRQMSFERDQPAQREILVNRQPKLKVRRYFPIHS